MAFDGIVCSAVVAELNKNILNGKINKIYQPNKNEILLGIYSMGKNYALNISIDSVNYRLNLTTQQKQNPKNVFNFCMVLRKHLIGGTIKRIYMNGLERIVYLDIEGFNELNDRITKTLIIELMGKHSNIILTNSNNVIIDSLRHLNKLDNSIRDIMPGCKYEELVNSKESFTTCSFDSFYKKIKSSQCNISSTISNSFIGISKLGIKSILQDLGVKDEASICLDDSKRLYDYIKNILKDINQGNLKITIDKIENNEKIDFYIKEVENYENLSINFFIDDFYDEKENKEKFKFMRNDLLKLILNKLKKVDDRLDNINSKLEECKKMDLYKLYGELITTNLYRIENYNVESVTLENYYKNNEKIEIPLDSAISPSTNAKKYFKKYRKLQNTKAIVQKQKELAENEVKYLDSIVYEINNSSTIEELEEIYSEIGEIVDTSRKTQDSDVKKKNKKTESNMPAEYIIDGFTVYVGKNNKQNDYLTCKLARNNDLWFHTKDIHGSHVVLRLDKNVKKAPDSVIYKCATIAAYFSKAKMSQNVPVDYTYIKYVKKPNGAKPGMVIYTDNKTLYVNPKAP